MEEGRLRDSVEETELEWRHVFSGMGHDATFQGARVVSQNQREYCFTNSGAIPAFTAHLPGQFFE
jgi:hypothetical protein